MSRETDPEVIVIIAAMLTGSSNISPKDAVAKARALLAEAKATQPKESTEDGE